MKGFNSQKKKKSPRHLNSTTDSKQTEVEKQRISSVRDYNNFCSENGCSADSLVKNALLSGEFTYESSKAQLALEYEKAGIDTREPLSQIGLGETIPANSKITLKIIQGTLIPTPENLKGLRAYYNVYRKTRDIDSSSEPDITIVEGLLNGQLSSNQVHLNCLNQMVFQKQYDDSPVTNTDIIQALTPSETET